MRQHGRISPDQEHVMRNLAAGLALASVIVGGSAAADTLVARTGYRFDGDVHAARDGARARE
jgi:hypothetical protein